MSIEQGWLESPDGVLCPDEKPDGRMGVVMIVFDTEGNAIGEFDRELEVEAA